MIRIGYYRRKSDGTPIYIDEVFWCTEKATQKGMYINAVTSRRGEILLKSLERRYVFVGRVLTGEFLAPT